MHPRYKRLFKRASVAGAVAALAVSLLASPSSAAEVPGKVTVTGDINANGTIKVISNFGSASGSESRLWNTEVRDTKNNKIAQWTETFAAAKGANVTRSYNWDTSKLANGTYRLAQGISKPNWTGVLAWSDNAGTVTKSAGAWQPSVNVTVPTTGDIKVSTKFVSPAGANGKFLLDTELYNSAGKKVNQWISDVSASGAQTFANDYTVARTSLPLGNYKISQGVWTSGWAVGQVWKSGTAVFNVAAAPVVVVPSETTTTTTSPSTTTTTAALVTTTTAAPTTTTSTSTTTTTAPTTTTTAAPKPTTTTTTAPTTTTTTAPKPTTTTIPAPTGVAGWTYVGGDEFNDNKWDWSHWGQYVGAGNEGVGRRVAENLIEENGELKLRGTGNTGAGTCWCGSANTKQTYGRWEVRAKMDKGTGYGPAILLWPDSERWPIDGEIDIMEAPGGARDTGYFTVHYGANNSQSSYTTKADLSQWHTYTVEWLPTSLKYYFDGKLMYTNTNAAAIPKTPMHLGIQNDVGAAGHWIPGRDSSTPAEVNLHIDYVKIYRPA